MGPRFLLVREDTKITEVAFWELLVWRRKAPRNYPPTGNKHVMACTGLSEEQKRRSEWSAVPGESGGFWEGHHGS